MGLTENTSLKITAPDGNSTTTSEMVIGKSNTYQRTFLIVAGSLLALLVMIVVAGSSGGQHLQSSAHEMADGAVTVADYPADSVNLALTKDMFGLGSVSENKEGCGDDCDPSGDDCCGCDKGCCYYLC